MENALVFCGLFILIIKLFLKICIKKKKHHKICIKKTERKKKNQKKLINLIIKKNCLIFFKREKSL